MRLIARLAQVIRNARRGQETGYSARWHGQETGHSAQETGHSARETGCGMRAVCFCIGLALSLVPFASGDDAQEPVKKWSVPARILGETPEAPMPAATAPVMPRPAAVSTGLLPPQYQTTRLTGARMEPQPDDATIRFLVSAVARPILVEAKVMIDGKPFRLRRDERIDDLLKQLAQVDSAPAAAAKEAPSRKSTPASTDAEPADKADANPQVDNSILARLQRYTAATKRLPSRDEIQWLLANWSDGPTLLFVDANYQRVRAEAAPLQAILDRDEDGVLAAKEIAAAEEILWKYDTNQDEVLTFDEINQGAKRTPAAAAASVAIPVAIPLSQLANPRVFQQLREKYRSDLARFDRDGSEEISESELAELRSMMPDLNIEVRFHSNDATQSRVSVDATRLAQGDVAATVRPSSVTLMHDGTLLEISASQSPGLQGTDQVSLGAIQDGFPLLPEMDVNEDGKLTIREVREVSKRLAVFDLNKDASVTRAEVLPTLRLCFGLGPTAHRPLATVRSIHPTVPAIGASPPDWFGRMDRNQDGDLSAREFLGGKEQFAALDADKDGLISIAEANASKQ